MTQAENNVLSPVLFLPHGGGPLPLFGDEGHKHLTRFLSGLASQIDKPEAILIISAHWEENQPVITSKAKPGLYYDYYNFPEETYHIDYPLAGSASLTQKVEKLLAGQGFDARLDDQRDFDHGVFVPLKLVYPDADIPCVQLSLVNTLDPQFHIQLGRALAPLRAENVLIIGSGLTFHNMGAFFAPDAADVDKGNNAFQDWLIDVCTSKLIDEKQPAFQSALASLMRFCVRLLLSLSGLPRHGSSMPGITLAPSSQVFKSLYESVPRCTGIASDTRVANLSIE